MKKTEGYVIRKLEEEYVLLPTGKRAEEVNEVISLSETAGFIYLHAEEAASIPELAELVGKRIWNRSGGSPPGCEGRCGDAREKGCALIASEERL